MFKPIIFLKKKKWQSAINFYLGWVWLSRNFVGLFFEKKGKNKRRRNKGKNNISLGYFFLWNFLFFGFFKKKNKKNSIFFFSEIYNILWFVFFKKEWFSGFHIFKKILVNKKKRWKINLIALRKNNIVSLKRKKKKQTNRGDQVNIGFFKGYFSEKKF